MIAILFLILAIIFAVLSGIFNGLADTSDSTPYCKDSILSKYREDVFCKQYSQGWKWMDNVTPKIERFFGSSTIFVLITDFWHFCQFLQNITLIISTTFFIFFANSMNISKINTILISLPIILLMANVIFEIMFSEILPNNNKYNFIKKIIDEFIIKQFSIIHGKIFKH